MASVWEFARSLPGMLSAALDGDGARVSLRTKGIVAFAILVLYVALTGLLIAQQRDVLRQAVEEQQDVHAVQEGLARVSSALAYAILNVNEAYASARSRATADTIALDIEAVQAGLQSFEDRFHVMRPWIVRLERDVALLRADWSDRSLVALRDSLHQLVTQLDAVMRQVRDREQGLSASFRKTYDSITLISVVMGLLGVVIFGAIVTLFFSRLVRDIRRLQACALEVVGGARARPVEVTRRDEFGALMESVNRMSGQLQERERQLEITRRQRFHQEKMAAIGSLAAAIAHEVNNPIAAISGVAEAICERRNAADCPRAGCRPELILEQTRRISQITRQLAEMTAPYSPEAQLLDLNALVRSTCGFLSYDKRFRHIALELTLDPQLPAVSAVADHLTQVLMNLLFNAADATVDNPRQPSIAVQTAAGDRDVELVVVDNGCGMDEPTRARAFEEAFTTKPPGKGSGLGLFMCRMLIEEEGGRIEIDSAPGRGTRVAVFLPRPAAQA